MKTSVIQRGLVAAVLLLIVTQVVFAQSRPDIPTNPFAANPTAAIAAGQAAHSMGSSALPATVRAALALSACRHWIPGSSSTAAEDFDLFQTIQKGVPGTQMPSFASFTPEQTWQLVSYLQSLSRVASASGSEAGVG